MFINVLVMAILCTWLRQTNSDPQEVTYSVAFVVKGVDYTEIKLQHSYEKTVYLSPYNKTLCGNEFYCKNSKISNLYLTIYNSHLAFVLLRTVWYNQFQEQQKSPNFN